jgi:hypothetical protein
MQGPNPLKSASLPPLVPTDYTIFKVLYYCSILMDAADIMNEARAFYQELYTPDNTVAEAIDPLLDSIPSVVTLSLAEADALINRPDAVINPPDSADIPLLPHHAPKGESPGLGGLPFEIYQYLVSHTADFSDLLLTIHYR